MYIMIAVEKKAMNIRDMIIEKMASELSISLIYPSIESTMAAAPMIRADTIMTGFGIC